MRNSRMSNYIKRLITLHPHKNTNCTNGRAIVGTLYRVILESKDSVI